MVQSAADADIQKAVEIQYFLKGEGDVIFTKDKISQKLQVRFNLYYS